LEHEDAEVQLSTGEALVKVGARGEKCAVDRVVARLAHEDVGVREAVVLTLECIALKGDEYAISLVASFLDHPLAGTRCAALQGLAQLRGHPLEISAVVRKLEDPDKLVRVVAVDALAHISQKDDSKVIACVRRYLQSDQADVRLAAVQTLTRVSTKGNSMVNSILVGCLKDAAPAVQSAVVKALGQTAVRGDSAALSALGDCRRRAGHCPCLVVPAVYEAETKIRGIAAVYVERPPTLRSGLVLMVRAGY
jgi:HEAT repeat protein